MRAVALCLGLVLVACGTAAVGRPYGGTLPPNTTLDLTGQFRLSPDGELRLALARPCTHERAASAAHTTSAEADAAYCDRAVLDQIPVVARAPWGKDIPGTWSGPAYVVFRVEWGATELDPLVESSTAVLGRPWMISGTQWTPTTDQVAAMLAQIGKATNVETELVRGGPPPALEVTGFEVEGGALHLGDPNTLTVRIANRGQGTAYRVGITTRSSIDALQDRRLSFGSIKPGTDKTRTLELTVPASETERDTMLVLVVSEGNGAAPRNVSRRIPIAPSTAAPALAMRCAIVGRDEARPEIDAGKSLMLRCTVDNTGKAVAQQVTIEASIAGRASGRAMPTVVPATGHAAIDIAIAVPRDLPMGAPVEIELTARDPASPRSARATVAGVVRKPRLCDPGRLTRDQYRAKLTELRAAVAAGDLTQAQLDRYDAELVTCLK